MKILWNPLVQSFSRWSPSIVRGQIEGSSTWSINIYIYISFTRQSSLSSTSSLGSVVSVCTSSRGHSIPVHVYYSKVSILTLVPTQPGTPCVHVMHSRCSSSYEERVYNQFNWSSEGSRDEPTLERYISSCK